MRTQEPNLAGIDPVSPRTRNRRNRNMIIGATVIGAAVIAGIFLIPRADIIESQLNREVAEQRPVTGMQDTAATNPERTQPLAGEGVFIIGDQAVLTGQEVSLNQLVNARDDSIYNSAILLRGAKVQSVPGDQVFTIGLNRGQGILVKIDEPTGPTQAGENALVVRPGQTVNISGRVERINSVDQIKRQFGVNNVESLMLGNTTLYIKASAIQLME